jgi:hypothetical protein
MMAKAVGAAVGTTEVDNASAQIRQLNGDSPTSRKTRGCRQNAGCPSCGCGSATRLSRIAPIIHDIFNENLMSASRSNFR